jgi:NAD(P)-dependent dehydrogenase (short-subunit alcohol dehydrogenase family)
MRSWRSSSGSEPGCTRAPRTRAAELEECRRRWEELKLPVTVSVCDVSVRAEREKLVETVKETFGGKLDILVSLLS